MNKPTAVRQWENEEGKYFIPDNSTRWLRANSSGGGGRLIDGGGLPHKSRQGPSGFTQAGEDRRGPSFKKRTGGGHVLRHSPASDVDAETGE